MRSHAVYNQVGAMYPSVGLFKRFIPGQRWTFITDSGTLVEGFRSIMFPTGTGVKVLKGQPIYMHIQTKGFMTAGTHCNIFYIPVGNSDDE